MLEDAPFEQGSSPAHEHRFGGAPRSPLQWTETVLAPPLVSFTQDGASPYQLRRWVGVASDIDQPQLTQPYIALHLGGPKKITRSGEGWTRTVETGVQAVSVIPAGAAYRWRTAGPVDFAHLYIDQRRIDVLIQHEFGRQGRPVELHALLGDDDRLLCALMNELLVVVRDPGGPLPLYVDALTHALTLRLLRAHSTLAIAPPERAHSLSPTRLRRVLDHIDAKLSESLRLDDLAAVAGCSPYHFSRAFAQATGRPPYAYLIQRRIAQARDMARDIELPSDRIASACGFRSV